MNFFLFHALMLTCSICNAFNNVIDTCAKTASYRAVSHVFPTADLVTKALCGEEVIKQTEDGIQYVTSMRGYRQGRNLREGFALRHYWINQHIEQCMKTSSPSQIVIFGAGFDTRAYNLPCLKGTTVYEIDMPEIIAEKEQILSRNNFVPYTKNIKRIGFDLGNHGVLSELTKHGFNASQPACYIYEGILYYLHSDLANTLLRIPLHCPGNTILLDTVTPQLESENCQALPFIKSGIEFPHKHLRRMGFNSIVVDQIGDPNANFGALDTSVPYYLTGGLWAYKHNLRITEIDGIRLMRFFLVKALT
jgi:methyltransferase (TIGR00027 family)